MHKFFGKPLQEVKGMSSGQVIFRFDNKGEFITDDDKFIQRAMGHFDHIEMKAETIGERVARTIITPPIQIMTKDENSNKQAESGKLHCKKCAFTCDNQGELMVHYRAEHPKSREE